MKYLKFAVLSLALLTILMNASIVPVISQISQAFPDVDLNVIKMNLSLPALTSIIFSLIAGKVAQYIPKKNILIFALLLFSLCGILSGWVNSIWAMLLFRALMGGGSGIIAPLVTDLIAFFYDGEERIQMIGYSNASSNLSGIFIPLLSGWLAEFSWRYAFWVYGIGLLVLLITWLFIPKTPLTKNSGENAKQFSQTKSAWQVIFMNFISVLIFYTLPSNISIYIQKEGIGTSSTAALLISISTLTSTIFGITFSRLYSLFADRLLQIGMIFCALGFFSISSYPSLTALIIGEILVGVGLGILFPYFSLRITQVTSGQKTTSALALLSSSFGLGIFLSSFFFISAKHITGISSIRGEFFISGCLFILSTLVFVMMNKKTASTLS